MPYSEDYQKWLRWARRQIYGEGYGGKDEKTSEGLIPYEPDIKKYWDDKRALGIIEIGGKFIGLACLVAKEVIDKESFVSKFGLSFEKDVQWRAYFQSFRSSF